MHASIVPLIQTIKQQWSSASGDWTPYELLFDTMHALMTVTDQSLRFSRELVPPALQHSAMQGSLQIMQQLHECRGALLPVASTAAHGAGSSSSSSTLHAAYIDTQCAATGLILRLHCLAKEQQLPADITQQVEQLLLDQGFQ